ncbi:unnamed protein product [Amoebophrya sp. A120]|nr:unnamed protein product [Amoebophrya sp. A120]|eukprot:GSA120T00014053001.1
MSGDSWMDGSRFLETDERKHDLPNTYDKFMAYLKPDIMYYLPKFFHDSTADDILNPWNSTQCVMAAQAGSMLRNRSVPGGPNNPANDIAIRDTVTEHDRIVVHVSGNDLHQSCILPQVLYGKSRQAIIQGLWNGSLEREVIDALRTLWRENFPRYLKFLTERKKPKEIILLGLPRTRPGYFRNHIGINAVLGNSFLASSGTTAIVNIFYGSLLQASFPVLRDTLEEIKNGSPQLQGIRITALSTNDVLRGDETPELYNQRDNLHPNWRGSEALARELYDRIITSPP